MKVGIIMGGISSEREVSLASGESIFNHIDKEKYEVIKIIINNKRDILEKVKGLDFALLALHGKFGEDGTVQAFLDIMDIPYSGCGALSSSLCMDKNLSKKVLKAENIRTAKWITVKSIEEIDYEKIEEIGYPVFVKPNNGGSSVATFKVYKKEDIKDAVMEGLKYDEEVIIESFVKGREITCPIFNGELFPILEIKSKADFYDYKQKYAANGAEHLPVQLEKSLYDEVKEMALKTFEVLKCEVYARVDMIISEEGVPYILEVNTLPGMTATSLFPQSAESIGISYSKFIDLIIETSLNKKIK
ncbi:D-alanine--D-alanine ligase [Clostridium perfringens]|uniref:D-alanine--D-alanine ligase n=1 Tax=Clostridium perfringens TaxID=1502 RepID=A0A2X2YAY7_CLOPF|nr:D-alanine--D-alanine ligase [Clostridium perfringens]AXH51876.1 D-alanine--D-alanine ligase [Clostridium perfringens]EDS81369.1 D-alanine--D-alanine ligase [Clostridium perfringens C str. JGS1495]EJT6165657.1 D-alanine--D-alanine ligase [Clostridium perfringens]EJT6657122.1 D-alanine--D-alanine ligase [Clostridium perfringens]ELC8421921.1 D-alanine--D-alanine ligase [Clostridium perfringens]